MRRRRAAGRQTQPPGERYLISERMITNREGHHHRRAGGRRAGPHCSIPVPVLYLMGAIGSVRARLRGTDERMTLPSVRLMRAGPTVDCTKGAPWVGGNPHRCRNPVRGGRAVLEDARGPPRPGLTYSRMGGQDRDRSDRPPQTMLATLYAKALDAQSPHSVLR